MHCKQRGSEKFKGTKNDQVNNNNNKKNQGYYIKYWVRVEFKTIKTIELEKTQ